MSVYLCTLFYIHPFSPFISISSIILSFFAFPLLPIVLTASSMGSLAIFSSIEKSLFKYREKSLRNKQYKIKEILDKLHLHFEKCREDNLITIEEVETFDKIIQEMYSVSITQSKINNDVFLENLGKVLKNLPENQLKSLMLKK